VVDFISREVVVTKNPNRGFIDQSHPELLPCFLLLSTNRPKYGVAANVFTLFCVNRSA